MRTTLTTNTLSLEVTTRDGQVWTKLQDLRTGKMLVDDAYIYRLTTVCPDGLLTWVDLRDASCEAEGDSIRVHGSIAGLRLCQTFTLSPKAPILEERLKLTNAGTAPVELRQIALGFQRCITDDAGRVLPELAGQRLTAIPFKHKASDPEGWDNSFTFDELLVKPGGEHRATPTLGYGYFPALHRAAEGWAWEMGDCTLGIFKFNQEGMEFSVIALEPYDDRVCLRFGGAALVAGDPQYATRIAPGQAVSFGVSRYELVSGGYHQAAYAFRRFLDEQGCRFPADYNPPIHWNELYDNPEWNVQTPGRPATPRHLRRLTYTRALMEVEAAKAVAYSAEALYMDPGWDTDFGTFLWGEEWLGPRRAFIEHIRSHYGLGVALHCPLATWMSQDGRGVSSWPREALRMDARGNLIEGSACLGSRQYLDEAAKRLLAHCADGVVFLMFDGNWWNGGCWNPQHGHPVPYTMEDHCRANLELARRIHERYPHVLIEMHDMITGGTRQRYTPVYYKYGLPHSYNENWGFELMWEPMEDLRSGRARALYYYNLASNVPIYLHIDLRDDNIHCLTLWWYASTCRHLGIGGTHRDPLVVEAQQRAMRRYRQLKPFYARGEFYGSEDCPEEAHLHVLRDRGALVLNLFNLQDKERLITGSISFETLGLDPDQWYVVPAPHVSVHGGKLCWSRRLPAWGTDVLEVWPVSSLQRE
jgi:hypothetical protein